MKKRKSSSPRVRSEGPKQSRNRVRHGGRGASAPADWIYGLHAALAAINNPRRNLHRIAVTRHIAESHASALAKHEFDVVERRDLDDQLPEGAVHQGIAVHAGALPNVYIEDIIRMTESRESGALVVLDQATDPRNIGAVMRSAAAFGALAVVVHDHHAPSITPTLAKAASGAVETVPLVRVGNLARAMNLLKEADFWCLGLDGAADTVLSDTDWRGFSALVFGAEGTGLRRLTRETCDVLVRIPINGEIESLNLSNAVAVTLYEVTRSG